MHGRLRDNWNALAARRDQTARHLAAGVALAAAAVAVSALIARRDPPTGAPGDVRAAYEELKTPAFKPPRALFAVIWPPLFMALTLSGLRLWNAPASRARTRALSLWTVLQGLNAVWMSLGPRRLGGSQLTTAVATLGTAGAYAIEARKIDAPASNLAAPYLGWMGLANIVTARLWPGGRSAAAG